MLYDKTKEVLKMSRKNLYEVLLEVDFDVATEYRNLIRYFREDEEIYFDREYHSLEYIIDNTYFQNLNMKENFKNISTMMHGLGLPYNSSNINKLLLLCEFLRNILNKEIIPYDYESLMRDQTNIIYEDIENILEKTNYKFVEVYENKFVIEPINMICESNEVMGSIFAENNLNKNVLNLKDNIENKKRNLKRLINLLEVKKERLLKIDSSLYNSISKLVLILNIKEREDNPYSEYKINFSEKERIYWYDELYQMILLTFLELNNIGRSDKIINLTFDIENKILNGEYKKIK